MENNIVAGNLEIEVNLHSSLVGVGGHCVPAVAGSELRHTHCELAAFADCGVNVLINDALVHILVVAEGTVNSLVLGDVNRGIGLVRGAGVDVELRGICLVVRLEYNLLRSHTDINAVLEIERVLRAVKNNSTLAADIDDTHLAALEEILRAELLC